MVAATGTMLRLASSIALCSILLVASCGGGSLGTPGQQDGGVADQDGGSLLPPGGDGWDPVPLVPDEHNSSGVTQDPNGNLIVDPDVPSILHSHIWIANSPEGTVSKIDTVTGVEVARYLTGPGAPDPSRTTVGLNGDVVVANRGGASAVRIQADIAKCPDSNGNGFIETSTGAADVLPWGQDECVLWFTQFAAGALTRAAAFDFELDVDGIPRATVWLGHYGTEKLTRLDPETGAVLSEISIAGHCPYGMAFDGRGVLWVYSHCSNSLLRVNTETLAWSAVAIPANCSYGVTVDSNARVWTSGGNCVGRYDPVAGSWQQITIGTSNRGLAADGTGSVWVADTDYGVHRIDDQTMAVRDNLPLAGGGFVGMAVDFHGEIWAVSRGGSLAYRINAATMDWTQFATGPSPYTYSDMTGFQLQNAVPPLGVYRSVMESCGPEAQWLGLKWAATTPSGTLIRFAARTGDTEQELAAKSFVAVASQPADVSPVDLAAVLEASAIGESYGTLLELEITLYTPSAEYTPVLQEVKVSSSCSPVVE